jgi:hypothetical protein
MRAVPLSSLQGSQKLKNLRDTASTGWRTSKTSKKSGFKQNQDAMQGQGRIVEESKKESERRVPSTEKESCVSKSNIESNEMK